MTQYVIATSNEGKIRDFNQILSDDEVIPIGDLLENFTVEETGETFEDNAKLKSKAGAEALNQIVIADDSGLEVEALNGEPGVYSARYAGVDATDEQNNKKLMNALSELEDPSNNRKACFVCVMSVTYPAGETKTFRGELQGTISTNAFGNEGFGYDPLFIPEGYSKTLAELGAEEKAKISHRKKAMELLIEDLKTNGHKE
ncbi:XTP/dITP diphosphatase [Abyssicoccus albus]|uniref:dITP/XTP pyrophosphatase n=1 Tax=Abyssicoccus albus TaxID=1817405 RepID=A0A3N5BMG3_9BACL|nr:XTP/dITP diphosphatase [Abyssicoccus albus]RPF57759.1 XTP/dITP diphosphohydrolase [Abyssicoccus albus]